MTKFCICALLLCFIPLAAQETQYAWPHQPRQGDTLAARFSPPPGFERQTFSDPLSRWLRGLPLKKGIPDVRYFNGELKPKRDLHLAVVAIDTGKRDLQQCADAVIRLRAEYLWSTHRLEEIVFNFTSGHPAKWQDWSQGKRPKINGNRVTWQNHADEDNSYPNFRRYMDRVFAYAGSYSLAKELKAVSDPRHIQPGDVFIQGGFPGHAVLVLDVVTNAAGERMFLIGQSYMPAQDFHVLKNLNREDGWYPARADGTLRTPEWTFQYKDLKRFAKP